MCIGLITMNIFVSEIHFVSHSPGALVYVSYAEVPPTIGFPFGQEKEHRLTSLHDLSYQKTATVAPPGARDFECPHGRSTRLRGEFKSSLYLLCHSSARSGS